MAIEKQQVITDTKKHKNSSSQTINTIEEFELIPENIVSEYVDGRIRVFDSLTLEQHRLKNAILMAADDYLRKHHITDKVFYFHLDVQLGSDIFEPDLFMCDKRILTEKRCVGVPDWIVEITTPKTENWKYTVKLKKYLEAGVKEYWIINPEMRIVHIYRTSARRTTVRVYSMDEKIRVGRFEDLYIDLKNGME